MPRNVRRATATATATATALRRVSPALATLLLVACDVMGEFRGVDGDSTAGDAGVVGAVAPDGAPVASTGGPMLAGCPLFPPDHIFNTRIDALPVHPMSDTFVLSVGAWKLRMNVGAPGEASPSEYGIPYNVVRGAALEWPLVHYATTDTDLAYDPRPESDCATSAARVLVSPCTAAAAPSPLLPVPPSPLVQGGLVTDSSRPYDDYTMLILDSDSCRLWEAFETHPRAGGGWNIFGSASFDLRSTDLRPDRWRSADESGMPILPLLVRVEEARSGTIEHALRFTLDASYLRNAHVWPARHASGDKTSTALPAFGQLFRLKPSVAIPDAFSVEAKAILTALKRYGAYVAGAGTKSWVLTAEPSTSWDPATIDQIESFYGDMLEAVDLAPLQARPGFSADSAKVPAP